MPPRKTETIEKIKNRTVKTCSVCKQIKPLKRFHKYSKNLDGHYNECKMCRKRSSRATYLRTSERVKKYSEEYRKTERGNDVKRKSNINMMKKYPEKYKTRYLLSNAIRDGRLIKRNICEICMDSPTQCHHEDYSKPLEIVELCKRCHTFIHNQYREPLYN